MLISSLIEVFGDVATKSVLLIIEKLLLKSENQKIQADEETKEKVLA